MQFKVAGIPIMILRGGWFIIGVSTLGSLIYANFEKGTLIMLLTAGLLLIIGLGTLLGHAMAHCLTAKIFGFRVSGVVVFFFGVAEIISDIGNKLPRQEFIVAAAGPAASLLFSGAFQLLAGVLGTSPFTETIRILSRINLFWALVNLIPAYPLDGGRILRSTLWSFTNKKKATRWATDVTCFGAVLFIGWSLYQIIRFFRLEYLWRIVFAVFLARAALDNKSD